jgi:lysophospholipase L1-like esterase
MKIVRSPGWRGWLFVAVLVCSAAAPCVAAECLLEPKPADPFFDKFEPLRAPVARTLLLKTGDRLAICGDSITQQRMYSRLMETYLAACVPELRIAVRQYGWSGETAEGFLQRQKSDCLRFRPTVATTCYGMNDYRYQPYDEATARWYREKYTAVVRQFKEAGARVVLGSPGCVGKVASWVKSAHGTLEQHNLCLCALRNIDVEIAAEEDVRLADVFWPMYVAGFQARQKFGPAYAVSGHDGVHPGWAGHLLMAYVFLKAMGLDGQIGTLTVDLAAGRATASAGHTVERFAAGRLTVTSRRYPFCAGGAADKDDSLRSGMALVPFNQDLNRLVLVVRGAEGGSYKVAWGAECHRYSAAQLAKGVNLAADFVQNPFCQAFHKLDQAVAAKQTYETHQVQELFHGAEGRSNIEAVVARSEAERAPLAEAVARALRPVTHEIRIERESR